MDVCPFVINLKRLNVSGNLKQVFLLVKIVLCSVQTIVLYFTNFFENLFAIKHKLIGVWGNI